MSSSTVTYTSISSNSDLPPWGFHLISDAEPQSPETAPQSLEHALLSPDYVHGPEYPEYVAPSDDEIPVEDQPLPADASPTTLSLCYVVDSGPEEDLEEDLADYLADEGDDDEEEEKSSKDDDDEEAFEEDEDEEEQEHLAPADYAALPAIDPVPSAKETETFETDESTATPPPPGSPQTNVPFS
ncbi:hypothetical protein Tco_0694076 [Tanacetum coccineum]